MRYVCLFALITSTLCAQDGAAIYKERCASCHDTPAPRVPSLNTIKEKSGEAIYLSLTRGVMQTQAAGLSSAQIIALITYIAPTGGARPAAPDVIPTCASQPAFKAGANTAEWNGWSTSVTNSRFQDAASAGLTAGDLGRLKLKWAFNLGDVINARSQPAVLGRYVFIGAGTGALYALDADSGCTIWGFRAASPIRGGTAIGDAAGTPAVFIADTRANVYAVNAQTGKLIWKVRPVDHFATLATATPRFHNGVIYQAFASFEEGVGADPKYECCTFRGSVVALNAANGEKIWQSFTIPETAKPTGKSPSGTQQYGPSGAGVWSTPTIDEQLGALYLATGDNYSDPPTDTSDAVLAMDLKTGKLLWSTQLTHDDAYNDACSLPVPGNCPQTHGSDFDFGQPPILLNLGEGKRELVIGQKSGMAHALDPDAKGKTLWQRRVGNGGVLGGSQWGSASDGSKIFVAISDVGLGVVRDPKSAKGYRLVLDPKKGGGLYALDPRSGKILWSTPATPCAAGRTDCSPAQSAAVTAIPGVVFSGSVDGHLRAYSASTGKVLWDTDTARSFDTATGKPGHGGSIDTAGPVVVRGMVFINSGFGQWGGMPGNMFLAFSVQ
ncbi:MAG TPA: PQQ-binding-like beta-propeller repeat protein [Bryobacteraceae bacterium]|nr:PQQ-binding-like beta-propeller repeat protein [Bryobacteraceae bacterium]